MKIFISWSGGTSLKVAEAFRDWLPSVIQSVVPYVSSQDIDKGARWSADISSELEKSDYGILCVTVENLAAPWLNFEAGALSKSFEKSRVSPFLFGVDRSDVTGPLLQFQSTVYEHDDILKLVRSINSACPSGLASGRLDDVFEVWWPLLCAELDKIGTESDASDSGDASTSQRRPIEEVVDEVLELVRSQQKLLSRPEELLPSGYLRTMFRRQRGLDPPFDDEFQYVTRRIYLVVSNLQQKESISAEELKDLRRWLRRLLAMADDVSFRRRLPPDPPEVAIESTSAE
jgi:hypothetical protein